MARDDGNHSHTGPSGGLDDLAVFLAVAETASFTLAAKRLGIPKSTVSRAVARLESLVGTPLCYRSTRRVGLTAAGRDLQRRSAPHVAALREALRTQPEQADEPAGLLRVTAPSDLGAALVAEVCAELTSRYPKLRIECTLTNRFVDLVGEGYDVAVRVAKTLPPSSLVVRTLGPVRARAYASPTYVRREGFPRNWSDVHPAHRVVFLPSSSERRLLTIDSTDQGSPDFAGAAIVCDDFLFVLRAVVAGAGVGVLPDVIAEREVAAGTLVRVLPRFESQLGVARLVYPPARMLPARLVAFRDALLARWPGRRSS